MIKLRNMSVSLLLLWMVVNIHTAAGSAGEILSELSEINSERPLNIRPEVSVDVCVGCAADLQCDESSEGLVKLWQTPFGSFGNGLFFRENDPININNRTLRIPRATFSHIGLYHCRMVDNRGTTVISYRVNVVDKDINGPERPRLAREAQETGGHELASGVVPAVLVSFMVAFTLGAFSRSYVIKCLQKTEARMLPKRSFHSRRAAGIGPFRMTSRMSSFFKDSGALKASRPNKSPPKWFWSKKDNQESTVEEIEVVDEAQTNPEPDLQPEPEHQDEEPSTIQPKRRSRVIKLYNYDDEGKRFDHLTDPEVVMLEQEEVEPKPRLRVMSLTRLSTIMSQVDTPDLSTYRRSRDNTPSKPDEPPQD
ncbi:uncharacterized protein LOC103029868 [Astyanax mexicanus]|uniref:uncharacterized protein LOC103029868 n=1 Tax=Astyanax mexicanus TaxID=7994 RepID=UPI0020CB11BC|nr:uncharacterized protein LOC103029868 [Astyanax mexicanus]